MKLLILLQALMAAIKICKSEDEPITTIILHDTRTEMSVEQVNNPNKSKTNEFFDSFRESEDYGNDLDFDYDDSEDLVKGDVKNSEAKEQEMQEVLLKAMRKPAIRKQIGEVIPILRVMSPAQRLTLAALVSSQIMSQNTLSESNLTEMAAMFAGKNIENADDRHNITEHLLLPISVDIAKMFKGLGKEMGRNLRQNFYRPHDLMTSESKVRRLVKKPETMSAATSNRRMDEFDYVDSEEDIPRNLKPQAEALKQPGKDECDFFTKSLCLEVSNYPTEAIISSLKKNQDIAKTFLTDFEVQPNEEVTQGKKIQGSGRRLERRQDGQNEIQDFAPEGSYMCPSSVKYARPKRARTTSGQWKYIVNAGDYTQTLRLEICQKPKSPCSYVTNHLNSQCAQVFNYHRLLTWDETKGLHMDIFKVPSCCSCHIQGYANFFPPNKDFAFAEKRREPLEVADFTTESSQRPSYSASGNKREVPKPINIDISPPVTVRNPPQYSHNIKEFPSNPVDHLVPPGPPLPLENEGIFNPHPETKYSQIKGPVDHNRRYPLPTEHTRTINKATERIENGDSPGGLTLPSKTRLKVPLPSPPQRPNLKIPPTYHPGVISDPPQEPNPIFDSSNQVHYLRPFPNQPPYPNSDVHIGKPKDGTLFITPKPNPEYHFQTGSRVNTKPPVQFFNSEYNDPKGLPSRINPLFVTPPKVKEIQTYTTTTTPRTVERSELLSSSGRKKINYNYHPIIDFFIADSKKKRDSYSGPQYLPLASQDWTPVVGH